MTEDKRQASIRVQRPLEIAYAVGVSARYR
jgi:hypothetical protein